ncbi:MAG: aminopeptidase, partial [Eggerthellaceae bacterium]|nr:aminopeptidase [Eggerthellaceae bacterium]
NLDAFGVSTKGNAEPLDNKRAALRSMLPSMSGSISVEPDLEPQNSTVSMTGSFAPIASTGSVGRVGDELVEGVSPDELYIDDADDSFSETSMTETGAYAGPGYMEMPESRASRFFGRFRKKDKKADRRSAQEWLDVEDDFNPTEVGAARGGWESFDNDDQGRYQSDRRHDDEFDDEWNGGAFSKLRASMPGGGEEDLVEDQPLEQPLDVVDESYEIDSEIDQIEGFYAKKMEVEVWFVALGSELAGNCGMKAFLAEHAADLRGSLIVNLDSLGAGTFTFIDREGLILDKSPSSRVRRYIKKAQQGSGVSITDGIIRWRDSAASVAMKHGFQGVTLAGMEGAKPALMAQGDDVLENVDIYTLYDRVDFIETMVRNI